MGIRLSKSALEKFKACPRCFWLEKTKGFKQPEGIRSGLPMGMDRILKGHYDSHRAINKMPEELATQLPGWTLFPQQGYLDDMRNWRKGLTVHVGDYELSTALDDLVTNGTLYAMCDYKTKAKATNEADTKKYYQTQADCYDLALNTNNYKTDGRAHFAYYYPKTVGFAKGADVMMGWECQLVTIAADPEAAKKLLIAAGKCLEGPMPKPSGLCGYCFYAAGYPKEDVKKAI